MHLYYRKTCCLCGSNQLTPVIDLGVQHLQGVFLKSKSSSFSRRLLPMSLVRCDPTKDPKACGLLQTEHVVPPELLYRLYWYRSGTNKTMQNHLNGIVDGVLKLRNGEVNSILDVGCNDGTLLNFLTNTKLRVGIDPSNILPESSSDTTYIRDFFPSVELRSKYSTTKFDVITSVAMFYDLEDPLSFAKEIRDFLTPDGIWVVEVSYMPQMLDQGSYDSICHEHLEYYSLATLEYLFKRVDLHVIRAEFNGMNGGSVRLFVTHNNCFKYKNDHDLLKLREIRVREFDMELDSDKPYRQFQNRMEKQRDNLVELLKSIHASGKTIHIYGASTKGNAILQWCKIDDRLIECAADRNPEKWGTVTPGSDIPIVSEAESRSKKPDYYLILPWHFREEFIEREKEILKSGTSFIFPLPEIEVFSL